MRVLVLYASWHGSTADITHRITAILADAGAETQVMPVSRGPDPGDYDAVVIGSAVHNQAWSPEALGYLRKHATVLAKRPV